MPKLPNPSSIVPLTVIELTAIIEVHLPEWKRACVSSRADAIILHELAFGTSGDELVLLACAIKYAAHRGKSVHVVCGMAGETEQGTTLPSGPTFRE
jgi:hypothetical protein